MVSVILLRNIITNYYIFPRIGIPLSKSLTVFIDTTCYKPYNHQTHLYESLGGTELTVSRIAEGLSLNNHPVLVLQHNRDHVETANSNLMFAPLDYLKSCKGQIKTAIVIRDPQVIPWVHETCKPRQIVLWYHDLAEKSLLLNYSIIKEYKPQIICVSDYHRLQLTDLVLTNLEWNMEYPKINYIHNPIPDDLNPNSTPRTPYKLLFASSPHKGLSHAVNLFKTLVMHDNRYNLYVCNPGYIADADLNHPNIVNLKSLSYPDLITQYRTSECVFYPNVVFPETFGLIYAEANACGTPVLTHGIGASSEVLTDAQKQIVDCYDSARVIEKLSKLIQFQRENSQRAEGSPIKANEKFRLSNILKQWEKLIS